MDASTSASVEKERLRHAPGWLLALLMAMTAIGPLSLNILVPSVPGLVVTFASSVETVQLTLSLYLLGLAISQLLLGPLSDRFGRRPVVLAGLLLTTVSSAAAITAMSAESLIVWRTIQAFGASAGLVIGRAIIRDIYDREHAAAMIGWVTTVTVVAPMAAPLIGGLLDTVFGWESTFIFVALFSAAVSVWTYFSLPETRPEHVTGGSIGFVFSEARLLFSSAAFNGYVLVGALGTATFFAFLGGAPHVVIAIMGRTSAEYGTWFLLTSSGFMLGNYIAAKVSTRFGIDPMIRAGIAFQLFGSVLAVAFALSWPDGGPWTVFAAQVFLSFGNGLFLPNTIAGAISVRPQAAGTASGVTGFVQMGMGALAAQAMSHVIATATTALPLAIAMLVLSVAATIALVLLVRR